MTGTKVYHMLRLKPDTHRDLRIIAAFTGERLIDLTERLAREERMRIGNRTTDRNLRKLALR